MRMLQVPPTMKPTKGRIVFWTRHHEGDIIEELVAIITNVNDDGTVNLRVFAEVLEDLKLRNVKAGPNEGAESSDRCWSWPPIIRPAPPAPPPPPGL